MEIVAEKVIFTPTVTERNGGYSIEIKELGLEVNGHTLETAKYGIRRSVSEYCADLLECGDTSRVDPSRVRLARRVFESGFELRL